MRSKLTVACVGLLAILSLFGINYVVFKTTGVDYADRFLFQTAEPLVKKAELAFERHKLVSVSEKEFEMLWREIAPELLALRGVPFEKAYEDMLVQFEGEQIDEAFVRKLIEELKRRERIYDGSGYFRADGEPEAHAPKKTINPEVMKDELVSVAFYLTNWKFYSTKIFEILTGQSRVVYVREVDAERGFLFEARQDMTMREFMTIAGDGQTAEPDRPVKKGERWYVHADHVRKVSRIFEIQKSFTDHLGTERTVTVALDLSTYETVSAEIQTLPDGTLLASEEGALQVSADKYFAQRVDGFMTEEPGGWSYTEGGKVVFRFQDGHVVSCDLLNRDKITNAEVLTEPATGRHILRIWTDEGTISLRDAKGQLVRTIDPFQVVDSAGNPITDLSDIGFKLQKQILRDGGALTVQPNLDAYVQSDVFMQKLVADVTSPYTSDDDRAQALLAFTQSFSYEPERVPGSAKTPKTFLLSLEGDCEDASIFTVSLWQTADFDAAFFYFKSDDPASPGHAAPVIADASCCSGAGMRVNNEAWLWGEPTDRGWKIGDDPLYEKKGLIPILFQRSDGPILSFRRDP